MTLRLTADEDENLTRLAKRFHMSKNLAAATAIDLVAPKADHSEFVEQTTGRLLERYSALFSRLAEA